jgi:hypothetical protein
MPQEATIMAAMPIFFEVEYWLDAHSVDLQRIYEASQKAFVKEWNDSRIDEIKQRVNVHHQLFTLHTLACSDGTTLDGTLTGTSPINLLDIGVDEESSATELAELSNDFPGLLILRSAIHRFWGSATLHGIGPSDMVPAERLARCLVRTIFYPCIDPYDEIGACGHLTRTFEEMTQRRVDGAGNVSYTYDGTFILGAFRWQAWRLNPNASIGDKGYPFDGFIGNGAGGGDRG